MSEAPCWWRRFAVPLWHDPPFEWVPARTGKGPCTTQNFSAYFVWSEMKSHSRMHQDAFCSHQSLKDTPAECKNIGQKAYDKKVKLTGTCVTVWTQKELKNRTWVSKINISVSMVKWHHLPSYQVWFIHKRVKYFCRTYPGIFQNKFDFFPQDKC